MTGEERSTRAPGGRGELAARYEELRSQALNGAGRGAGLMVFLRQGMRAWMETGGGRADGVGHDPQRH